MYRNYEITITKVKFVLNGWLHYPLLNLDYVLINPWKKIKILKLKKTLILMHSSNTDSWLGKSIHVNVKTEILWQ
jgi:hypothetical protein